MVTFYLYAKSPDGKRIEFLSLLCHNLSEYRDCASDFKPGGKIRREDGNWTVLKVFTDKENRLLSNLNQLNADILGEILKEIEIPEEN